MQRFLTALILTVSCAAVSATAASAATGFTFSNTPGKYPVGLRVKQQYDYTRVYKTRIDLSTAQPTSGERARPIQALVWYPAAATGKANGNAKPLLYRDYLATMATETDFTLTLEAAAKSTAAFIARQARHSALAVQESTRPMWAVRDAAEQSGKFPVLIYAPSLSASAMENADLCEYLASHGYLVLSSASVGPRSRAMTSDLEGLEGQVADIGFLIAQAQGLAQADMGRIGVIGFSWGGLANAMAAAKDDRIGALVSLDGSMRGYREFIDGGKDSAKYVTPARLAVPLLYMGKRPLTVEALQRREIQTEFSIMNRMVYSDVYIGTMNPMNHGDFASDSLRFAPDLDFDEYSREEAALAHSWTMRYVHRFLDAYLKQDAAALAFLNNAPKQNGVPAHMLAMDIRRAKGAPPTMENFVGLLARDGFAQAIPAYTRLHAQDASFALDPNRLNTWGYELMRAGRGRDALEIFKLATHLYPTEGNLFDSLAESYDNTGDKAQAIANYKRARELDPGNKNALARLKALGAIP